MAARSWPRPFSHHANDISNSLKPSDGRTLSVSSSQPSLQYDHSSGQVFTETICRARPNEHLSEEWHRQQIPGVRRNGEKGACTLEQLAMREIMRNITSLTPDIWAEIPWHIGKRIWAEADKLDIARLSVWKGFVSAYNADTYSDENFRAYIRFSEIHPRYSLNERLSHLSSPSCHFITCLTISSVTFDRADIINISTNLKNLGALDISISTGIGSAGGSEVDDSVIRNWGRRAVESKGECFPRLRVLLFRNQLGLSARCFQHLNNFPSLLLFGVQGCGIGLRDEQTARRTGWTSNDSDKFLDHLQRDIALLHTWDAPLRLCFEKSESLLDQACQRNSSNAAPILSFRIGPTSKEVLYNASRIMFFRSTDSEKRRRSTEELQTEPVVEIPGNPQLKKRKLRKTMHMAVEDIFDEMRMG